MSGLMTEPYYRFLNLMNVPLAVKIKNTGVANIRQEIQLLNRHHGLTLKDNDTSVTAGRVEVKNDIQKKKIKAIEPAIIPCLILFSNLEFYLIVTF